MNRKIHACFLLGIVLLLAGSVLPRREAQALPAPRQTTITSPSQLIDVVNNLRAAYGLPALAVHSALMQSAQSQADYMASTGQITHSRPGGITFTQQLLNLGFPLAGEIRSENILNSGSPLVWSGVPPIWQDSTHMNTMISASNTHIGAGVSQGSGGYYYAVDCAAASGSASTRLASATTTGEQGAVTSVAAVSQYLVPVIVSTAEPDGNVFHILQNGQTLWNVAIEYNTTIKEIQALNGLGDDLLVWQGQKLLVKRGATQPAPPTLTPTEPATATPLASSTPTTLPTASPTALPITPTQTPQPDSTTPVSSLLVGSLIIAALVGGGVAVWLIRDPQV
jgi:LysM repeat protein